jgi:hypothetical protein
MSLWRQLTYGLRSLTHRSARDRDVADEVDAGKYFWRSGREKCFSLDIPFYRTFGPGSMHYEKAPRFRRSKPDEAPPPLRCAVQGFAPLRRR